LYNNNKVEGIGSSTYTTTNTTGGGVSDTTTTTNTGNHRAKSDAFYHLLKGMVERGVPIHGAGMQAHFDAGAIHPSKVIPTPGEVKAQIHRIGKLGLSVNISEMDVRVGSATGTAISTCSRKNKTEKI